MRKILFRGKRTDNNKWVYGSLVTMSNNVSYGDCKVFSNLHIIENIEIDIRSFLGGCCTLIDNDIIQIHKDTACQYTGLNDKNGVKIFEGDIVNHILWDQLLVSVHSIKTNGFVMSSLSRNGEEYLIHDTSNIEIIGNIHDNGNIIKQ